MRDIDKKFLNSARNLVGATYKRQGRSPFGIDCAGYLILAAQCAGFDVSEIGAPDYSSRPDPERLRLGLKKFLIRVTAEECGPGTIVLLREGGLNIHLGILDEDRFGNKYLLHGYDSAGKVISEPITKDKELKFVSYWKLPDEVKLV